MQQPRIWLVEDEQSIADTLVYPLQQEGFQVTVFGRGLPALEAAAQQEAPGAWTTMPSGAGHDAQYIAKRMPAAMLFTPSIGGISHHWAEDTTEEDLALCCQVLTTAAAKFLAA